MLSDQFPVASQQMVYKVHPVCVKKVLQGAFVENGILGFKDCSYVRGVCSVTWLEH